MKKIALLHTVKPLVWSFENIIKSIIPGIEVVNILDETIVRMVTESGGFGSREYQRMFSLLNLAETSECDAILITCSTLSNAADHFKRCYKTPIYKIDEAMIREAVKNYNRITVVATAQSTLLPTKNSLIKSAAEIGKEVDVETFIVEGAFEALQQGHSEIHDELIKGYVSKLQNKQVVLLAQASMGHLDSELNKICTFQILSSPTTASELIKSDFS